jgi:hypothetical protein
MSACVCNFRGAIQHPQATIENFRFDFPKCLAGFRGLSRLHVKIPYLKRGMGMRFADFFAWQERCTVVQRFDKVVGAKCLYCTTAMYNSDREDANDPAMCKEPWEWRSEEGKLMDWSKAALPLYIASQTVFEEANERLNGVNMSGQGFWHVQ